MVTRADILAYAKGLSYVGRREKFFLRFGGYDEKKNQH